MLPQTVSFGRRLHRHIGRPGRAEGPHVVILPATVIGNAVGLRDIRSTRQGRHRRHRGRLSRRRRRGLGINNRSGRRRRRRGCRINNRGSGRRGCRVTGRRDSCADYGADDYGGSNVATAATTVVHVGWWRVVTSRGRWRVVALGRLLPLRLVRGGRALARILIGRGCALPRRLVGRGGCRRRALPRCLIGGRRTLHAARRGLPRCLIRGAGALHAARSPTGRHRGRAAARVRLRCGSRRPAPSCTETAARSSTLARETAATGRSATATVATAATAFAVAATAATAAATPRFDVLHENDCRQQGRQYDCGNTGSPFP